MKNSETNQLSRADLRKELEKFSEDKLRKEVRKLDLTDGEIEDTKKMTKDQIIEVFLNAMFGRKFKDEVIISIKKVDDALDYLQKAGKFSDQANLEKPSKFYPPQGGKKE